ncbi:hypothetical protein ACEQPO_09010 [Bacillus sp. SL00103]
MASSPFIIVSMTKIQSSNETEVQTLLNVQKTKASFESVEQAMTNYSMTLSDEQLEVVQTDISTAKTAANVKQKRR